MIYYSSVPWPWSWLLVAATYMGLTQSCSAAEPITSSASSDRIIAWPGQPENVSFGQFSGYINVDGQKSRSFFYYFAEAETDPNKKPLVLWLNGGPGCSSIGAGLFMEHGPFKLKGDVLIRNPSSWNKVANMLYVESPAGVGFSYSANKSYYSYVNDEMTAQDNLGFLKGWLLKFPQYNSRDLFLAGESYAGHYIPQLAQLIVSRSTNLKRQLKGIAIGNGLLDFETDFNSGHDFWWSHGLITDSTRELLNSVCNFSRYLREVIRGPLSESCMKVFRIVDGETGNHTDAYDVIGDVCLSEPIWQPHVLLSGYRAWPRSQAASFFHPSRLNVEKEGASDSNQQDLCIKTEVQEYLNREDVQKAVHAHLNGDGNWSLCSGVLHYDTRNREIPMRGIVGKLLTAGIRTMLYSGDQDSVVPFIATRIDVAEIAANLKLKTTVKYRNWFQGNQVGGWTQVYGDILTFATVRGAAHMTPLTHPERSLELFSAFLSGKPLPNS